MSNKYDMYFDETSEESVTMKTISALSLFVSDISDITMNSITKSDVSMKSLETLSNPTEKHMLPGLGVIGDDFMRMLISYELFASDITDRNEKQFGFCISGQTVREAFKMVMDKQDQLSSEYRYLIVNIGAIDILLERDLIDIETDIAHLIRLIFGTGLQPIITTIPHLLVSGNHPNEKIIRQTLMLFNKFLMNTYGSGSYLFADLNASLFNGKVDDHLTNYQKQPKVLSVNNKQLQLWNWNVKGRKKILEAIDACIKRIPAV